MNSYEDIIHLPHHVSRNHQPMTMYQRAGQFAPFAALTGHGAAIDETARLTDRKIELSEEGCRRLNQKLLQVRENLESRPIVTLIHFLPDEKKAGGRYVSTTGIIKQMDETAKLITLEDKQQISLNDILDIQSEIFVKAFSNS